MTRPHESPDCRCEGCAAYDEAAIDAAVTDILGGPERANRLVGITTPPRFDSDDGLVPLARLHEQRAICVFTRLYTHLDFVSCTDPACPSHNAKDPR